MFELYSAADQLTSVRACTVTGIRAGAAPRKADAGDVCHVDIAAVFLACAAVLG